MTNSLRVCHIIHDTQLGGTETMLYQILRHQDHRQISAAVVSLMQCGPIGHRIRRLNVPVYAVAMRPQWLANPVPLLRLWYHVKRLRPDVVHSWGYHANLVGGVIARLASRAAVVWSIRHGSLQSGLESKNTLRAAKLGARLSHHIPARILLNSESAIPPHQQAGYATDRMVVVPNGFDLKQFCPPASSSFTLRQQLNLPPDTPLVGMCGRFHRHKGHGDFVTAAARIAGQLPAVHFLLAGPDNTWQNQELSRQIHRCGLASRFHLLGPRGDMPRVLASLNVYVLASLTEAMPNVVGEAMACGVPCVVTDVGDAARLVHDTGLVVPPRQPDDLAVAVSRLLRLDPPVSQRLGARARQRIVEHYEIQAIARRYEEVWSTASGRVDRGKVRLVHVTTVPWTQWLFLRGQNEFMARRGFDVHAVSGPGSHLQDLAARDPVTTHTIPSLTRRIRPWRDLLALVELTRLLARLKADIVQVSTPKAALLGALAARWAGTPVRIYQVRGLTSENSRGLRGWLLRRLERCTARLCNAHLVNSPSLLDYARQSRVLRDGEGVVIGAGTSNGLDTARFCPRGGPAARLPHDPDTASGGPPDVVIGYVGRLTRDKGMEELCRAWLTIRVEFPTARMLLVGPWESHQPVARRYRQLLAADPRVVMPGGQRDVTPFYRAMDMFVFPSHGTEGLPNAPLEAAAMGLPVIATQVVGNVDAVIDGVTGRLVPPRDSELLAAALRAYLRNDRQRNAHGKAGQTLVRTKFAQQEIWAGFYQYYQALLVNFGRRLPGQSNGERPRQADGPAGRAA